MPKIHAGNDCLAVAEGVGDDGRRVVVVGCEAFSVWRAAPRCAERRALQLDFFVLVGHGEGCLGVADDGCFLATEQFVEVASRYV